MIEFHREKHSRKQRRYTYNANTYDIDVRENIRVHRIRVLVIDGERYTENELRKILRVAKKCGCEKCFECEIAREAKRAGL
jgi:hypothetical protein